MSTPEEWFALELGTTSGWEWYFGFELRRRAILPSLPSCRIDGGDVIEDDDGGDNGGGSGGGRDDKVVTVPTIGGDKGGEDIDPQTI
ncbi:hypothetical protein BGZ58_008782, partial [Dissophora ornata]